MEGEKKEQEKKEQKEQKVLIKKAEKEEKIVSFKNDYPESVHILQQKIFSLLKQLETTTEVAMITNIGKSIQELAKAIQALASLE